MEDGLPGVFAIVHYESVAVQAFILCNLARRCKQAPDGQFVFLLDQIWASDGFARHNEDVGRSHRIDVPKGNAEVVFVDPIGWNLPVRDFLKEGFLTHGMEDSVVVQGSGEIANEGSYATRLESNRAVLRC